MMAVSKHIRVFSLNSVDGYYCPHSRDYDLKSGHLKCLPRNVQLVRAKTSPGLGAPPGMQAQLPVCASDAGLLLLCWVTHSGGVMLALDKSLETWRHE